MKIIELNIVEFGCIKDKKLSLSEGLNVISGDNESGKSTVMLFIKFMLYGLPRKTSRSSDRERALSWDNHRAAGTMLVENKGKRYLIERRTAMGARLSEACKLTDLDTGEVIEGVAGEVLLEVPAEVFESSCFMPQMRTADISRAQASGAIENMLVSADESIDVTRILEKIDKVRKEYRLNRGEGGLLYDTEQKLSALRIKHREAVDKHLAYNDMNARLLRTEKNIEKTTASYAASKHMLDDINNAQLIRRFDELGARKKTLSETEHSLADLEASVSFDGFIADESHVAALTEARATLAAAHAKAQKRAEELSTLPKISSADSSLADMGENIEQRGGKNAVTADIRAYDKKRRTLKTAGTVMLALCAVCGVAASVLFLAVSRLIPAIAVGAAALLLLAVGMITMVNSSKLKRNRDAACGQYGVGFAEIDAYLDGCLSALARRRSASSEAVAARVRLDSAEEDRSAARDKLCALAGKTVAVTDKSVDGLLALSLSESERLGDFCRKRAQLRGEIYALGTLVSNFEKELSAYDEQALRESVRINVSELTQQEVERARTKERFDRERLELLQTEARNLRESLAALRAGLSADPVEIADTVCELEQRLVADTEYYDALMLAKEHIERASEVMSGSVTPEIGRRASEMMSLVSDGAHSAVQTTKSFDISVEQDGFLVSAELLSGGTRDAAYICLRIALMQRLFGASMPPLIMDESLCQLDDDRARNVLSLLSKLSDTTQCILFTCHTREASMCKELGIGDARYFSFAKEK